MLFGSVEIKQPVLLWLNM